MRTLSVSRATVRKVVRGPLTEFGDVPERGVQPSPKLGDWVEALTEVLEKEAKLPNGNAARPSGCLRSCVGADMTAPTTACIGSSRLGATNEPRSGPCLCADELRAWGGLPVRLKCTRRSRLRACR